MKKISILLVLVLCGLNLSAQSEMKLSGSVKITSETIGMIGGAIFSEHPSFGANLALKKGNWNISLARTSDIIDKKSAGNYTHLTGIYSKKIGNWTLSPTVYLFVFDEAKMNMFIPTAMLTYSDKLSVELVGAYAYLFEADNLVIARVKISKSYQDWIFASYFWEKSKVGSEKWETCLALQVSKRVFQCSGISLSVETTYHFTNIIGKSSRFGWIGLNAAF